MYSQRRKEALLLVALMVASAEMQFVASSRQG
jgi:hypothetical protein